MKNLFYKSVLVLFIVTMPSFMLLAQENNLSESIRKMNELCEKSPAITHLKVSTIPVKSNLSGIGVMGDINSFVNNLFTSELMNFDCFKVSKILSTEMSKMIANDMVKPLGDTLMPSIQLKKMPETLLVALYVDDFQGFLNGYYYNQSRFKLRANIIDSATKNILFTTSASSRKAIEPSPCFGATSPKQLFSYNVKETVKNVFDEVIGWIANTQSSWEVDTK